MSYPLRAGGREVVGAVADSVRATQAQIDDLRSAAVADSGVGLNPDEVLAPLVRGLLRPMSAAWRGRPEARAGGGRGRPRSGSRDLRGTVRVLEPPSPYALGTSDAPLLVTIGNGLPFTVRVRLEISSTSGLRVAPIEMQQVPPLGRRQVRVSAQVTRSGQFTVQASVRAPDGALLGPPSRLRVRSTAYGTITVWLTASAGVLLVVLAVRRVRRRVRDRAAPAHRRRSRSTPAGWPRFRTRPPRPDSVRGRPPNAGLPGPVAPGTRPARPRSHLGRSAPRSAPVRRPTDAGPPVGPTRRARRRPAPTPRPGGHRTGTASRSGPTGDRSPRRPADA